MARYHSRFVCGHSGCEEYALYESDTRKEQADLYQKYANGRYRCVRHANNEVDVLSDKNPKIIHDEAVREESYGKFWGNSGFIYGPGFKAFTSDFPVGTIIRVTAEIISPTPVSGSDET